MKSISFFPHCNMVQDFCSNNFLPKIPWNQFFYFFQDKPKAEEKPIALNLKKPAPAEDLSKSRPAGQDPKPKSALEEPLEDDEKASESAEAIKVKKTTILTESCQFCPIFINFAKVVISYHFTVWKFSNFPTLQILCEINYSLVQKEPSTLLLCSTVLLVKLNCR